MPIQPSSPVSFEKKFPMLCEDKLGPLLQTKGLNVGSRETIPDYNFSVSNVRAFAQLMVESEPSVIPDLELLNSILTKKGSELTLKQILDDIVKYFPEVETF